MYVHYTPDEERRNRKLVVGDPYTLEELYEAMLEDVKSFPDVNHRDLQHFMKYSMSCVFYECTFEVSRNKFMFSHSFV